MVGHAGDPTPPDARALAGRLAALEAELESVQAAIRGEEGLASALEAAQRTGAAASAEVAVLRTHVEHLSARPEVRLGARLRRSVAALRRPPRVAHNAGGVETAEGQLSVLGSTDGRYPTWVALYDTVDDRARTVLADRLATLDYRPLVSVLMAVHDPAEAHLRAAVASVQDQRYDHWELCIADDASRMPWVVPVLDELAATDPRIRVEHRADNGHISAATNTALAMASGEWVTVVDHDDVLAEHALAVAVLALAERPEAGLLYSDEDHLDVAGARWRPYFKPDFDPLLLVGQNYLAHLCLLRRDLVERAGGYRIGYEGAQDWDLVLRVTEQLDPGQVVHVPHVLYHWRVHPGSTASSQGAKPYAADAARRAVQEHLTRTGRQARVTPFGESGFQRVAWELPHDLPSVGVVLVARRADRLARCVASIRTCSSYPGSVEVVVADDGAERSPLRQWLVDHAGAVSVFREDREISDAALRNAAARATDADVLVFVDDDVEVLADSWIEELVGVLMQPGIGAVGAKLLYPDRTVEHAGVVMGIGGSLGHPQRHVDRIDPGYVGRAQLTQTYSAVSGACMALRRQAFDAVGGFDEEHGGLFAAADLCLRLGEAGWRVAWTPHAQLLHFEDPAEARPTAGENAVRFARDVRYLQRRWRAVLDNDPAYNPNLTLAHETMSLAWPPRRTWSSPADGVPAR